MSNETKVVNIYHKVPYDIYIGRGKGSKWGNPYSHLPSTMAEFKVETREEAIQKFDEWLPTQQHLMDTLDELDGKTLGCFCKPKPCHGDILIKYLNLRKGCADND